jgi:hypothetical protein
MAKKSAVNPMSIPWEKSMGGTKSQNDRMEDSADMYKKNARDVPNTVNNTIMGASFNPQPPSKRIKMYEKVNECDY